MFWAMLLFIELYPEKRDDKHMIKKSRFPYPATYDGESGRLVVKMNEQRVETVSVKIHPRRALNEYGIDLIPAIISLDMVSGMYSHMALRKTHSC